MEKRILAVDDDTLTLKMLSAVLTQAGYLVDTAGSGPEAFAKIDVVHPDLIILDVIMPEMDGYAVCRRLRRDSPTALLPIMMLTSQDTIEEKIKGFEAGADQYVTKPFDPLEILKRIQALLGQPNSVKTPRPSSVAGKVIAVFSLRGGVGVSTVAANLAVSLSQLWDTPAVLVDLVTPVGHDALLLNLALRATWNNLDSVDPQEIEPETLERALLTHSSGTRVLASPRHSDRNKALTASQVKSVITMLRQRFPHIVLDLSHDFHELALAGLDLADEILLLFTPELPALLNTSATLEAFESLGYPRERVRLILNHVSGQQDWTLPEMARVLKQRIAAVIPFAPDSAAAAIAEGLPLVLAKPTDEIAISLEDLAFTISAREYREQEPAQPSPAWMRISSRRLDSRPGDS